MHAQKWIENWRFMFYYQVFCAQTPVRIGQTTLLKNKRWDSKIIDLRGKIDCEQILHILVKPTLNICQNTKP